MADAPFPDLAPPVMMAKGALFSGPQQSSRPAADNVELGVLSGENGPSRTDELAAPPAMMASSVPAPASTRQSGERHSHSRPSSKRTQPGPPAFDFTSTLPIRTRAVSSKYDRRSFTARFSRLLNWAVKRLFCCLKSRQLQTLDDFLQRVWAIPDTSRLTLYLSLLLSFVGFQLLYALAYFDGDSLAYALRTLLDISGPALSLGAMTSIIWTPRKDLYPYGYSRYHLLAAFTNCLYVIYVALWRFVEGVHDFYEPQLAHSWRMVHVFTMEAFVNVAGILLFLKYRSFARVLGRITVGGSAKVEAGHTINCHSIVLHAVGHTAGCMSSLIQHNRASFFENNPRILLFMNVFVFGILMAYAKPCVKHLANVLLQTTPSSKLFRINQTLNEIRTTNGVIDHHGAHWWTMDGSNHAGSLCITVKQNADKQMIADKCRAMLSKHFKFLTVQIDTR